VSLALADLSLSARFADLSLLTLARLGANLHLKLLAKK